MGEITRLKFEGTTVRSVLRDGECAVYLSDVLKCIQLPKHAHLREMLRVADAGMTTVLRICGKDDLVLSSKGVGFLTGSLTSQKAKRFYEWFSPFLLRRFVG